jgi:hypothetical protein
MIKIKLPTKIEHCRPDQLAKWMLLAEAMKERNDDEWLQLIDFQCQLLSIFSGQSINKIKQGHIDDIQTASSSLVEMLSKYKQAEPNGVVEIEGKKYYFYKDFRFITTGQIIDLKLLKTSQAIRSKRLQYAMSKTAWTIARKTRKAES